MHKTDALTVPYLQTAQTVARALKVVPSAGLTSRESVRRRQRMGSNVIPLPRQHLVLRVLRDRLSDVMVLILLLALVISLFLGETTDALIIAGALLMDTALSLVQVWRTERALRKLRQHVEHMTFALRDGKLVRLPSTYLVVGDIIEFRAGERIPTDARVLTASGLRVAESSLTGESHDVAKSPARLRTRTPLGDRRNMVFLGTTVTSGNGRAIVTAIGTQTEFGKIAQILKTEASPESPLRRKLGQASLTIGAGLAVLVVFLALISLLQGTDARTVARMATTLMVSAIPEDLTIILTIALTVGVVRILKQRGVVRELRSAETLGAATVICTDKTGTLTEGNMKATEFDFLQGGQIKHGQVVSEPMQALALTGFALASDAHPTDATSTEYVGSATERTALAFVERLHFNQTTLRSQWRQRDSLSFNAHWKYRASLHDHPTQDSQTLFVSGAPEVLLEKSSWALDTDYQPKRLTARTHAALLQKIHSRAEQGERLLGMAVRRHVASDEITHTDVTQLLFLGVLVITDPIRHTIRPSIEQTTAAGITVKVVTGDYAPTARAVARAVGLTVPDSAVLTGEALQDISDEELRDLVETTVVFARVNPLDKQRIIRALQARGHVVAMTGDGVNDTIALKAADIGVAMGSGKDIAKDTADLVILDDSFTTIVQAIREGRVIRDNVRKVIAFLLATNVTEVVVFLLSLLLQGPLPLLPAQILWINLVTDGTSDIALSLEPEERQVMRRHPEHPATPLLHRSLLLQIVSSGVIMSVIGGFLYWYLLLYLALDEAYGRTMVFTFISVASLLSTLSFRSLSESMYRRGFWQNPWVSLSIGFSLLLQLVAIYSPPLQRLFETVPLNLQDWLIVLSAAAVTVILIDTRKFFFSTDRPQRTLALTRTGLLRASSPTIA